MAFVFGVGLLMVWAMSGFFLIWTSRDDGWAHQASAFAQAFLVWSFVGVATWLWFRFRHEARGNRRDTELTQSPRFKRR